MTNRRDFTDLGNYGNNPLRAEQLRIASTIDLDDIEVLNGPPGSCGFRKGTWTVAFEDQEFRFFDSIPHGADLGSQRQMVREGAARHIAGLRSGYIKASH